LRDLEWLEGILVKHEPTVCLENINLRFIGD